MTDTVESISQEIYDKAFQRVILTLNTMNCKYEIFDRDGNRHTSSRRGPSQYPRGFWRGYVKNFLEDMKPLETRYIDCGELEINKVQAAACNYMVDHYELGIVAGEDQRSYTTNYVKEENKIKVTFLG
jgi:hypothetical protein